MVKLNIWEWEQLFNKIFNFTKWASKNFVNGDNIHKTLENVYGNEEITIDEFVDACCEYIGDSDFVKTVNKYVNQSLSTDEKIINALNVRGISNKYKESINGDCYIYYDDDDGKRNVFCDYVKGITDTRNWFYLNKYIIDAIHIFKNEKQAQKFIDEHLKYFADQDKVVIAEYPQTVSGFFESKKSARKSLKEQFVGKGKGGYRKPDKTKFNSGICFDSNGKKHTVIFDTRVEDFIVWVDDDNYLMWNVSSPQSLLNNLAESDLDENLILDIVALWEKLPKKNILR